MILGIFIIDIEILLNYMVGTKTREKAKRHNTKKKKIEIQVYIIFNSNVFIIFNSNVFIIVHNIYTMCLAHL